MFTIEQIKAAHSQVKTGADFPNYIQDLITLGVTYYTTYVADGHTDFEGKEGYMISSPAKYDPLRIANQPDAQQFKNGLKQHQGGETDYPAFCSMCAETGVEKWSVSMAKMTCTYYGKTGNEVLVEVIPH